MLDNGEPTSGPISDPRTDTRAAERPDAAIRDAMALIPQNIGGQSLDASGSFPDRPAREVSRGVDLGAAKPLDMTDDQMFALDTCGKYGGVSKRDGGPCDHPSSFGIPGSQYGITPGRCFLHTEERLELRAQQKAQFLSEYIDQPKTLEQATKNVGIATGLPYLWAQTDPAFRRMFRALVEIVDAIRNHIAEDSMFERIRDVESGADTLRMFYFQNRNNRRWRDVRKEQAQAPTIVNTGSGDVRVTYMQMGDEFIPF